MASTATAKGGGAGLNRSSGQKGAKRKSSSAAHIRVAKTKDVHRTKEIKVEPKYVSLSEKRRFAAIISWEKRRKGLDKKPSTAKVTAKKPNVTAVTHVQSKNKLKSMQEKHHSTAASAATHPPTKKRKIETESVLKALAIRSNAAKLGWEKRRSVAVAVSNAGSTSTYASSADSDPNADGTSSIKTKAANTQCNEKDAIAIRIDAAKLGWERRRNQIAAERTADDASSAERQSFTEDASRKAVAKKTVTASKKAYTAAERRKAAIAGWEKRKAARTSTNFSPISDIETSVATVPSMLLSVALPTMPTPTKEIKDYREGKKRSRRLAEESTESYEEEVRKINKIVSYLRQSRGWLEFRPSSRRGSGTATYGYIPSSIASFIRNGTISQRTVLDRGTLGVHYALDWHGYGGLKDMISTFGEDYSPYPTEEMMEQSRDTEWELSDDLPWREMLEDEKKKLTMISAKEQEPIQIDEDIFIVATILANLDRSAAKECEQNDREDFNSEKKAWSAATFPSSPVTLKNICRIYNNFDEYDDYDSKDRNTKEVTLSHMANDQPSAKIVAQVFSNWNFGLS
ncbi:hypothetical protein ACHAXA_003523 [Cyclostephanos tholiformis]|uniref:Uncharacterized protein n=1 Tax=Cyclostephanos tholiformis TaxID=382380 RepID=A0ABD3R5T2_9STRA